MVAVGIDLGTTYSVVALADASLTKSRVLPNREGKKLTPSAVFFDGEQPVVGAAAVAAGALAPGDYVELVKRQIGDPSWRFETTGGTSYSAEEISALIVRQVVEDAEHELDEPCSEAVITVPAYFDDARRRSTCDAGIIAGVDVLRIINEPTAAALAYGFGAAAPEHGGTFESTLLVYDWGGGTFDATVVGIYGDDYTVLATAGDRNLGGFDLDNALMLYVDEAIVAQGGATSLDGDIAELALREHCEQAKRALSALPETVVAIPVGGTTYRIEITQPTFADLARPLLRRTEEIVAEVMEDADTPYGGLTAALLVGGSTRAPMVSRMLSRVTGASVRGDVRPDEAVALGAAIAAADASAARRGEETPGTRRHAPRRLHISDVTAHSLGLLARDGATGREINSVVVKRNEPLPAVGKKRFHTLAENQREILVVITEGEDTDPAYVTVVGSARIPVPESQDSVEIEVAIGYDNQGMIEVTVTDVGGGVALGEFSIDRLANADSDEVHRMRRSLTALSLRAS